MRSGARDVPYLIDFQSWIIDDDKDVSHTNMIATVVSMYIVFYFTTVNTPG